MFDTPQTSVDAFVANSSDIVGAPKIVTLSDGHILVAYATPASDRFLIKGQMFDAFGKSVSGEFNLPVTNEPIDKANFDIAVLPKRRIAVAVDIDGNNGRDAGTEIVSALIVFNDQNEPDSIVKINHDSESDLLLGDADLFNLTVTRIEDGFRVYYVDRDRRGNFRVKEGGLDDGRIISSPSNVKNFSGNTKARVDSAALENGTSVIILDRDGEGSQGNIHFAVRRPNRSTLTSGETGERAANTHDATVTALKGGGFVIAWTKEDGFDTDVQFERFSASGRKLGDGPATVANLGEGRTDDNNEPTVAALEDGGFIVFYDDDRGSVQGIHGQRYDSDGDTVGERFRVSAEGFRPDSTLMLDGRVAVAFRTINKEVRVEFLDIDRVLILGGDGDDVLTGTDGPDEIRGGAGDDLIQGGAGDDVLFGGTGSDIFVFTDNAGANEIRGFNATNEAEKIDLSGVSAIVSFADLLANHLDELDDDVVIDDRRDTSIILRGVRTADLDETDFIF